MSIRQLLLMGGTLNATNLYLDPAGVFAQSGGTASTDDLAANGKFNLSGGTLKDSPTST